VLPVLAEWMGHSYHPPRRRPVPLWTLLVVGLLLAGTAMLAKGWLRHPPALFRPPASSAGTTAPAPSPGVNQATGDRTSWPGPAGVVGIPAVQTPTITP
jgi:hypothetical protein